MGACVLMARVCPASRPGVEGGSFHCPGRVSTQPVGASFASRLTLFPSRAQAGQEEVWSAVSAGHRDDGIQGERMVENAPQGMSRGWCLPRC